MHAMIETQEALQVEREELMLWSRQLQKQEADSNAKAAALRSAIAAHQEPDESALAVAAEKFDQLLREKLTALQVVYDADKKWMDEDMMLAIQEHLPLERFGHLVDCTVDKFATLAKRANYTAADIFRHSNSQLVRKFPFVEALRIALHLSFPSLANCLLLLRWYRRLCHVRGFRPVPPHEHQRWIICAGFLDAPRK